MMLLTATAVQAQISIGGSIYGGGNAGNTGGGTKVTVYSGNLHGEHASDYILVDYVYGGNDIAGTIGSSESIPTELTEVGTVNRKNNINNTWNAFVRISSKLQTPAVYYTQAEIDAAEEGDDAFGKTTDDIKTPAIIATDNKPVYIGQLFGGGNGYYD